ncbi:hypothetical protein X766_15850 [Mesorhizobium sp. LSJC255A00]|uniref:hypothetical protein n=1 Tax=Mesorhizobium sp. LSJC255A00 TaxID=1287313 RepID=UPI0003CDD84C|nr:hypothetical protein [Mesorhizobium sp. LSJC255A00]ESX17532.1 hypothetical protein X766_15850 [Mesorhizobium sp. LSJC255A00]
MTATASGADGLANTLLTSLLAGKNFTVPNIAITGGLFDQPPASGQLYADVDKITVDDLTTGIVGGTGVFDKIMSSLVAHLKVEYQNNRISGAEYTKAYIGVVAAALQTSSQFLLAKDQAYWQALLVQAQARSAEVELVTARVNLETARIVAAKTQFEAATAEANYGLTKIKISTEDATYANLTKQGVGIDYTNANILPKQLALLSEQIEVQRAQTLNNRTDGATITGSIGKQKDLYTQQITSYQRDAETKFVKMFSDAWTVQKTIDEGLVAPTQFTNANVDAILSKLKTNLSLT